MICPKCGVTFEDPSFIRCPRCGWQHPDPLSQREGLPWERRREIGRIIALWETTRLLLLSPTAAMRLMRNDRARDAMFYFWAMAAMAAASHYFILDLTESGWVIFGIIGHGKFFSVLGSMVIIGIVGSLSLHVLTLSHPNTSLGVATTLYHYCAGSTLLLASVPYFGWLMAFGYCGALLHIGLINLCGVSYPKDLAILICHRMIILAFILAAMFLSFWLLVRELGQWED